MKEHNLGERISSQISVLLILNILLAACTANPKPVISIQPAEALFDQPVSIRLSGFKPNQEVTVRVTTTFQTMYVYESDATFRTDAHGSVDLDHQAPLSGSYTAVDGMGLFWSMALKPAASTPTSTNPTPTAGTPTVNPSTQVPYQYQFTAEVDGQTVAQAVAVRTIGLPGMTRREVRENGLYGVLYTPPGNGPFPVVITLGGSDGGLDTEEDSHMLATHGYAALALAYFDPLQLSSDNYLPARAALIPLEYFGKAIEWLRSQPTVDPNRVGIIGWSLGGQAALLIGATYPQIKAVIAISAPTIVRGVSDPTNSSQSVSYWSIQGQPVPFLSDTLAEYNITHPFTFAVSTGKDALHLIPGLVAQFEAAPELMMAAVPVAKIKAPVLLISGLDDRIIPSSLYGEFAIDLLKTDHFAYSYRHIINPGAGHGILFPYIPEWNDKRDGEGRPMGGNAQSDAHAEAVSWPVVLEYLGMMK